MANHVILDAIQKYLLENSYPPEATEDKEKIAKLRKDCKPFSMLNGHLLHKNTRLVISSKEQNQSIIYNIHVGLSNDSKAKAMASDSGRNTPQQNILEIFLWHNIKSDID